jgi:hypothetical protein
MRKTLIHIGYHKTGTSWLQRYLFGRRDRGFAPIAPENGLTLKQSAKFLSHYFVYDEDGKLLSPFKSRADEVRALLPELLPGEAKVPVVSAERLSGNPHSGGFDSKTIAARLAEIFPDGRILIVIREQASMILSTYFQYLKIGGTAPLRAYLTQAYDGRLPGFGPTHLEYHRLIDHYQGLFGRDNVLVLPYETFRNDAQAFVAALADFAEAEVDAALEYDAEPNKGHPRLVEYRTRFLNPLICRSSVNSYSALALPNAVKPARWLRQAMANVLPAAAERRFVDKLRAEIKETIGDRYADSNARTAALIDVDLKAMGYR